jgi:hypothetical protein
VHVLWLVGHRKSVCLRTRAPRVTCNSIVPIEGVVFGVLYISVRNVVLVNDWNVECEWLPSQTDLESGRMPSMISRRLINLSEEWLDFSDYSSLEELSLEFLDSSSLEELSSGFSDSSSLVDLLLISVPSLSFEGGSVGFLEDSSSEVNRGCFGLSRLLFFANGVTLLFFEVDDS